MTELNTNNLEAKMEDGMIRLNVTGPVDTEETTEALEWFNTVGQEKGPYDLYLEIPNMHFDGLGSLRKTFINIANIMRGMENCNKCAIVTDSPFLRSTAQIEGAVLPNMTVDSFAITELHEAETWLENNASAA